MGHRSRAAAAGSSSPDDFWAEFYKRVLREVRRLGVPPWDAPAVAQDVLIACWRGADRARSLERFSRGVCRHKVSDYREKRRRRKREQSSDELDWIADHRPPLDFVHIDEALRVRLREALDELNANERAALYFYTQEKLITEEIAVILGATDSTVRSWLARARKKARGHFIGREREDPGA